MNRPELMKVGVVPGPSPTTRGGVSTAWAAAAADELLTGPIIQSTAAMRPLCQAAAARICLVQGGADELGRPAGDAAPMAGRARPTRRAGTLRRTATARRRSRSSRSSSCSRAAPRSSGSVCLRRACGRAAPSSAAGPGRPELLTDALARRVPARLHGASTSPAPERITGLRSTSRFCSGAGTLHLLVTPVPAIGPRGGSRPARSEGG